MANAIVWFDVPVSDLDRATNFYSHVLGVAVEEAHPGVAVFAHGQGEVSGCLFKSDTAPGAGPLLYFNVDGRLEEAVAKATELGGRIDEPAQSIGEYGRRAVIFDTEGNRIALHSG